MSQITVYGAPWCPDCRRTKAFLANHQLTYAWVDIDADPAGLAFVEGLQSGGRTIPTVVFEDGSHLLEPTDEELARKLGIKVAAERSSYDLVVVGGGPAGLAAAIYAAREGIDCVVVDSSGLGGNASLTERIENYPGFPEGIGGSELMDRFVKQAQRYGVELVAGTSVTNLRGLGEDAEVTLGSGQQLSAHAVLLCTGSTYRRLGIPGEEDLIGAGVHFCATCDGPFYRGAEELLVVGGGNAAVEEGMFLSQFAKQVRIVQKGPELTASQLLQDKARADPRFIIHTNTSLRRLRGNGRLEAVDAVDDRTGEEITWTPAAAFIFIGQDPNSGLADGLANRDPWRFVQTSDTFATSAPWLFAAGDVRSGSTKQLASAVGEGVAALLAIRSYLQQHHHLAVIDING